MSFGYGNPLAVNRVATAAIAPYRIVKFTATDGEATQASAGTDESMGVSGQTGADAAGDRLDINIAGVVPCEFGGAVAAGKECAADANGKAVAAVAGDRIIGFALENMADTEVGPLRLAPGRMAVT